MKIEKLNPYEHVCCLKEDQSLTNAICITYSLLISLPALLNSVTSHSKKVQHSTKTSHFSFTYGSQPAVILYSQPKYILAPTDIREHML